MLFVTVLVSPFQKVWSRLESQKRHLVTLWLGVLEVTGANSWSSTVLVAWMVRVSNTSILVWIWNVAAVPNGLVLIYLEEKHARGNFYRWPEETLHCQLPNIVVTMQCRRPYNNNNNIQLFAVVKPHRHSFGQNSSLAKMHLIFASGLRSASFKANRHNLDPWFCHSPHPPLCHSFPGCYHQTFATPTFYNAPLPHPALQTTPRHLQKSFQPSGALGPIYRYFFQPLYCCLQRWHSSWIGKRAELSPAKPNLVSDCCIFMKIGIYILWIFLGPRGPLRTPLIPVVCCPVVSKVFRL